MHLQSAVCCIFDTWKERNANNIPNVQSRIDNALPTLFLGHFAENHGTHYIGLLPEDSSPESVSNIIRRAEQHSSRSSADMGAAAFMDMPSCSAAESAGPIDLGSKSRGPNQPQLPSFRKIVFGKQNQSFPSCIYANFLWIEYSVKRYAVFCFACRNFHTDRHYADERFIT